MYKSYVKILLDFINNDLYEPVNETFLEIKGEDDALHIDAAGYQMKKGQYLAGEDLSVDVGGAGFMISFWIYPKNQGIVINPYSKIAEELNMPLLMISDTFSEAPIFNIQEASSFNRKNFLKIIIPNGGSDFTLTTLEYDADIAHHVLIGCNVNGSGVSVFIDGKYANNNEAGDLPMSFEYTDVDLFINKILDSEYQYNYFHNIGIISDICIVNMELNIELALDGFINGSLLDFVSLTEKEINYFMNGLFNDPATLKVNVVIDDMSYAYLARNDGTILKGSSLLWESRRVFSNPNEKYYLEEVVTATDNPVMMDVKNGFLQLTDSFVRL